MWNMLRVARSLWIWAASAALVILWVPVLGLIWIFDKPPHLRTARWFRRLGRILARIHPSRVRVSGESIDPSQVYVIVSNHQSLADIPVLSYIRLDTKWLAKAELFRVPLVGWMMKMAGDVPVNRSLPREGAKAILQCGKYLRQRCSVVFFPEGTRSKDGEVQPFNEGAFQLAIREKVPILPLVVEGTGQALPSKTWLWSKTRDIHLRILKPVSVEGWGPKEAAALCNTVRQNIVDELDRLRMVGSETAA